MTFSINANNIDYTKVRVIKDGMKTVTFTDQNGKEHTHKRFPTKYDYEDVGNADIFYVGGNITEPTLEDPLAHTLKCSLSVNKFRKPFEKVMKDEKGVILLDSNGKPRTEIILSGSPYSLFISPRKGKDPEFDAFDKGTTELRRGLIEGFISSPMYKEEGYDVFFSNSESCGFNVMKKICNHPLIEGSTVKRNKSKPKFAVYDVYDTAPFEVPIGKDSSGKFLKKSLSKELLSKGNIEFYGLPKMKYHLLHVGGEKMSAKSYCIGASVLDVKKREGGTNIDDLHTGQVGKVDVKAMEDSIKNLELEFDEKEKKDKIKATGTTPTPSSTTTPEPVPAPTEDGVMTHSPTITPQVPTPTGAPTVDMSSMTQYMD